MNFIIGQKVSYPNQGVCRIESIDGKKTDENATEFYALRVLANKSLIRVPVANAAAVGVRPVINVGECKNLLESLAFDFDEPASDWKTRTREFGSKLQTGDIFAAAEILKKLAFVARLKKLSFREQKIFEKAKFLVVSELAVVCSKTECSVEAEVSQLLTAACNRHDSEKIELISVAAH